MWVNNRDRGTVRQARKRVQRSATVSFGLGQAIRFTSPSSMANPRDALSELSLGAISHISATISFLAECCFEKRISVGTAGMRSGVGSRPTCTDSEFPAR